MLCPRCQHENPPGTKFCGECASPLASTCPSCGATNAPGNKFCGQCAAPLRPTPTSKFTAPESYIPKHLAEKILTSRAALEGERKQVTVLFADLKGSMELLADRDPEEARKLLDPVLEHMMEAVHRYEGTVNQVMGDGIMALFGAPLAHEDHAVRACYAALRMQESVKKYAEEVRRSHGAVVKIRVGLNSGEVVVRAIGSDLRMDYTAVGQTTHLAARMEQLADPGAIVITPETLALAKGYVEVKSLGPVRVKGLAATVEIYEVTDTGPARTRLQATAQRGLSQFVGRDAELEHLRRVQRLARDGHGQVVAVVGEAGVGKSRLVYEFSHSVRLQDWLVLESAPAVSYDKATSYLPVIQLLKGYFEIQDRDDSPEIREKVTRKLLSFDGDMKSMLPALLALLNVAVDDAAWRTLDPGQRRQQKLEAVKQLVLREARKQPLLLIFEDLHWIDSETQAVLDTLVNSLGSARLLLFVNYRPEYEHPWGSKRSYSQMRLDTLPAESAAELLDVLLGTDPGLAPLKHLLVKRANPFFLEETIRTLVETKALAGERGRYRLTRPVQAIQVPPTVEVMLAARIDRLPPEDKRLLQVAATIGKDVPFALLQAISDLPGDALRSGLGRLQTAEFLYETGPYPDLEYSFKHALTHDVAYGGLLQARRRELHTQIVAAIETLHPNRLAEQIERLAHHAVRGELGEKAVHYLREAGLKAARQSAFLDARIWFEQAVSVLEALPESRSTLEQAIDIRLLLRPVLTQLGEARLMLVPLAAAETFAERLDDEPRRGRVCALMTNLHTMLGELDEARLSGDRALAIAEGLGDVELRILTTSFLGQMHYFGGEYGRAVELAAGNLAMLPGDWISKDVGIGIPASNYNLWVLVLSLAQLGRFAQAAEYEASGLRIAESTHHTYTTSSDHWAAATRLLVEGEWATARSLIDHWITVVRTGNLTNHLTFAVASSAWVLAQMGETTMALSHFQEGEKLVERHTARGVVGNVGWAYASLGRAALLLRRFDEARHFAKCVIQSIPRQVGFVAHALHLLGDIATHPDRFDAERGEAHYREALALAEPRGMRPLVAHCHLGLGKLYRRTGKREQAREHFATATTMYHEMDMQFWLEQADAEIAAFG